MSGINPVTRWLVSIRDYFRFVGNRRLDIRFDILPARMFFAVLLFAGVASITSLIVFADPVYLQWFQAGNAERDGWFAYTTDIGKSSWILMMTGFPLISASPAGY